MTAEMEFLLLGPVEVRSARQVRPVGPGKQRAVLAALLLRAGRLVSLDELAEMLWWPKDPPPSAHVTARNYVMRLRQALGDAGRARISTQPGGYLIRVDDGELDVSRFEALLGTAWTAARDGSWDTAAEQARAALALWRDEPLADVPSELLRARELPRLHDLRLAVLEARVDADLQLGRSAEVTAELQQLAAAYPLRERVHAQLMLALYRSGRQGEALAVYRQARQVLVDELGAEPGTELRGLHRRMLAADPALVIAQPAPAAVVAPGSGYVVPRELPVAAVHFTGRDPELAVLTRQLAGQSGGVAPGALLISAIGGTAGVGKTALAVYWAHQVARRFPDGQLYVDLRGYDPGEPVAASAALAAFLGSLGVPGGDIPAEEGERAARYRSLLAGRRVLVVLDNAGSAPQVRPLLPAAPGCMTVVTSRDSLAGLVARDGARRLDLGLLPLSGAVGLLRALIGGRVDADPDAAAALAEQCSRLPLALRVAAELAAASPATPLAELVTDLADQRRRLDALDAGDDPATAVRAVFSWSYRQLDAGAARMFRLMGVHPGPDCDRYAAAALAATTAAQADEILAALARGHLVQQTGPGRYGMHDLLRAYARDLADGRDGADGVRAALTRLSGHYLHAAAVAMDQLFPAEQHSRPRIEPPAAPVPPLAGPAVARAWLDTERRCLVAAAAALDVPAFSTRLAAILFRYLDTGGYLTEAVIIHGHARAAACRAGDRAAEANALTSLGVLDTRQGRVQSAATHFQEALALARTAGDHAGEVRTLGNLGILCLQQGSYQEATDHLERVAALYQLAGDQTGEARALASLATIAYQQGHYDRADAHLQRALVIFRDSGDRTGEAHALTSLGEIKLRRGQCQQAADLLQHAHVLFAETGSRPGEARTLNLLGDAGLQQGHHDQAADCQRRSLAISQEIRDRPGEATALDGLGEALLAAGRPADARVQHLAALSMTTASGERYEQARAHCGLAGSFDACGEAGQARWHWQEALALYTALGAPEVGQVRARLDGAVMTRRRPPGRGR